MAPVEAARGRRPPAGPGRPARASGETLTGMNSNSDASKTSQAAASHSESGRGRAESRVYTVRLQ